MREQRCHEIVVGERRKLVVLQLRELREIVGFQSQVERLSVWIETKRRVRHQIPMGLQPTARLDDVVADVSFVGVDDDAFELTEAPLGRAQDRNVAKVTNRSVDFFRFQVT